MVDAQSPAQREPPVSGEPEPLAAASAEGASDRAATTQPSRFARRPGPNADPFTRRDETLAFAAEAAWQAPAWFGRVVVVLYETNDQVNIGGVVRALANCGFWRLRLVRPVAFDPWRVVGVAHYTEHIVAATTVHATLDDALADATLVVGLSGKHHRAKRNLTHFATALERVQAGAVGAEGLVAILLGREDTGLPNETLDRCHLVTTIPTNPAYPSLNLAQAALLTLHSLFLQAQGDRQLPRPPRRKASPATAGLLEDLFADVEHALQAIGFGPDQSLPNVMRSLRTMLYRAELDQREAGLLRAIFIDVRRRLHRQGQLEDLGPIGAGRHRA